MFYGKSCDHIFNTCDNGFDVYFVENEEADKDKYVCDMISCNMPSISDCILWAGWKLFCDLPCDFKWDRIVIQDKDVKLKMKFKNSNELVESIWRMFNFTIDIDEDGFTMHDWFIFPERTVEEDILYWFDNHHSGGISYLTCCLPY